MHFIFLLKKNLLEAAIFLSFGLQRGRGKERKGTENQPRNICALSNLIFYLVHCPKMNLVFKLASQKSCSQAALFSQLWQARSWRGQGADVQSVLCSCKEQGLPRTTDPQRTKGKEKYLAPKLDRSLGGSDYKTETGFCG